MAAEKCMGERKTQPSEDTRLTTQMRPNLSGKALCDSASDCFTSLSFSHWKRKPCVTSILNSLQAAEFKIKKDKIKLQMRASVRVKGRYTFFVFVTVYTTLKHLDINQTFQSIICMAGTCNAKQLSARKEKRNG
ncbi:Plastin-1 [Manis javanica]|nr:Plastin-1 [Manis javanica]